MFDDVIIDISKEHKNKREYRLYPFLYLIAERVIEAGGQGFQQRGSSPDFVQCISLVGEGRPHFMDAAINDQGVLFTPDLHHKAAYLQSSGVTSKNAALLLAAAGLEITVPNFTFNIARSEEVMQVREKLEEEKSRYLSSVIKLTDEAFDRIGAGVYEDTVDWALNESFLKIKPKAVQFENAMSKLDQNILRRIGFNLISDGIPAIGSALVDKGFKEATKVSMVKVLEVLCKNLVKSMEERKIPEVVYGYKVNQHIKKL